MRMSREASVGIMSRAFKGCSGEGEHWTRKSSNPIRRLRMENEFGFKGNGLTIQVQAGPAVIENSCGGMDLGHRFELLHGVPG